MNYKLLIFVLYIIHISSRQITAEKIGECSPNGIHCSSCNEVSICVNTEYGSINQHVHTCPEGEYCMKGMCSKKKNPICDGTADIPFHCHGPGVFPDPFDCHYYHLCVVTYQNETDLVLEDYKHKCQHNKGGRDFGFESRTLTCSDQLGSHGDCVGFPIPPCLREGQTMFVAGNRNIYFVCESIKDLLYPQLFACPFGQMYNPFLQLCEFHSPTTPPPATTSPEPTTMPWQTSTPWTSPSPTSTTTPRTTTTPTPTPSPTPTTTPWPTTIHWR